MCIFLFFKNKVSFSVSKIQPINYHVTYAFTKILKCSCLLPPPLISESSTDRMNTQEALSAFCE